jgi:uncharacterized membrane protein
MRSSRLEAFSDGVLAIIITIMVLELKLPEASDGHSFHAFFHTTGLSLLTYLLSFVYVGIYWNNHHHMFQIVDDVDGVVLWANLHLLFWLSLYPLTTNWLAETDVARDPTILYGVNLLGAALAYFILQLAIMRLPGGAPLREALGSDIKGKVSPILYVTGIGLSFLEPWFGLIPAVIVAGIWLIPDRRLERWMAANRAAQQAP